MRVSCVISTRMEKGGGSRLLQMQARFQQKQLQERELKIASLYEAQQARALDRVRQSPSNGVSTASPQQPTPVPHQPGKVRQMFEERRTKAGIDKSYPLQPIHNTERTNRKTLPNGYAKVSNSTTSTRVTVEKRSQKTHTTVSSHSVKKQQKIDNLVNGSGDLNHNHEDDISTVKHTLPQSNGEIGTDKDEPDKVENNNDLLENETFPEMLAPIPTPRTPEPIPETKKTTVTKTAPAKTSPVKSKPQTPVTASPRRITSNRSVSETTKTRGAMQRPANTKANSAGSGTPKGRSTTATAPSSAAASGDACGVCGRHFASDRIAKHQEICKKAHSKKRKPFDVLKHRLAGTEAEPFINKLRKTTATPSTTKVNKGKQLNSNWRQKHEEFIQAIRAAKQVQAHLNAGGKLSDLPPPPPSENPDYVQCPHCNRRFNQGAAERHIPKCANFQFNKPKPAAKRR